MGTDLCVHRPGIGSYDAGLDALLRLFVKAGCVVFEMGSASIYLFNALMFVPTAYLIAVSSSSRREFGIHLAMFVVFLGLHPNWFDTHVIEGLTTLLVYLAILYLVRMSRRDWRSGMGPVAFDCAVFGSVFAMHYTIRESAASIPMVGLALALLLVACGTLGPRQRVRQWVSGSGFLLLCLSVAALALLSVFGLRLAMSSLFGESMDPHGSGSELCGAMGWADNPYNLVWDDDFLFVQLGWQILSQQFLDFAEASRIFAPLCRQISLAFPEMVISSLWHKLLYLFEFCISDVSAVYNPVQPSRPLGAILLLACGELVGRYAFRWEVDRRSVERKLTLLSVLGGALAVPLLFLPVYLVPLVAFAIIYGISTVALAADWLSERPRGRLLPIGVDWRNVSLLLGVLLPIAAVYVMSSAAHRRTAESMSYDVPSFASYDTLVYFNILDEDRRSQIVEQLASSGSDRLFLPEREDAASKLALVFDDRVCVVHEFDRERAPKEPLLLQGPRNAAMTVLDAKDPSPERVAYLEKRFPVTKIHDAAWNGQTKMLCLSTRWGYFRDTERIRVNTATFASGHHAGPGGLGLATTLSEVLTRARSR